MPDFFVKRGDLLPKLKAVLRDATGAAINLTGTTVTFRMRLVGSSGPAKVERSASITSATGGEVEFTWQPADTDTVGVFFAEWIVNFGTSKQTHPNNGYITVEVVERLAA